LFEKKCKKTIFKKIKGDEAFLDSCAHESLAFSIGAGVSNKNVKK